MKVERPLGDCVLILGLELPENGLRPYGGGGCRLQIKTSKRVFSEKA